MSTPPWVPAVCLTACLCVIEAADSCLNGGHGRSGTSLPFQELTHARQIIRSIDTDRSAVDARHPNPVTMLERPQLFERLGSLQRRGSQCGIGAQEVAAVGV